MIGGLLLVWLLLLIRLLLLRRRLLVRLLLLLLLVRLRRRALIRLLRLLRLLRLCLGVDRSGAILRSGLSSLAFGLLNWLRSADPGRLGANNFQIVRHNDAPALQRVASIPC